MRLQLGERTAADAGSERVRTRADERHLSRNDVEQLRQLVQAAAAQEAAGPGHSRVVARGLRAAGLILQIHPHGAELDHAEHRAVASGAALQEQGWAWRVQAHEDGDAEQERRQHGEQHGGESKVERPLG